jgi:DNA (cytosine-5)-methyltransferase 1
MVIVDCGVELSGPLSARDYKDAGTDGMNKNSAKMIPVIQETVGALCADSHPGGYSGQDAYTGRLIPQPIAFEPGKMKRLGYGDAEPGLAPTLRAEAGDNQLAVAQPVAVYENHPSDSRVKELGDVSSTVRARWGTGGGNAPMVAQPVGTDLFNGTITGDISMTLKRGDGNPAINQPTVMQAMAVRRLTPVECERLQGFPDNYSNIPWRKAAESPDGPRYKALGNSWAVPVVAWIGKRIQDQLQ